MSCLQRDAAVARANVQRALTAEAELIVQQLTIEFDTLAGGWDGCIAWLMTGFLQRGHMKLYSKAVQGS